MRHLFILLLAISTQALAQKKKPFPQFEIQSEGKVINNDSLKGKVVFINFWFSACSPCIAEFEGLNEMYEKLKDSSDIVFISITFDSEKESKSVRERFHLNYPMYSLSPQECTRLLNGKGYPSSFILDREGRIVFSQTGGPVNKAEARKNVMNEFYKKIMKTAGYRYTGVVDL